MSIRYRVAVLGFSGFERSTFESFFRLAARRSPAFDYGDDVQLCDFLIADSDHAASATAAAALERPTRTLYIGARPGAEGAGHLPRPINLMQVLRLLDELARQMGEPALAPLVPAPIADAASAGSAPTPVRQTDSPAPAPPPHDGRAISAPAALPSGAPAPVTEFLNRGGAFSNAVLAPGDDKFDHILVVDDSDVARRFMQSRLKRFGFKVHLARSGEEALNRISEQQFEFVFLDVMMEGIDGYLTCKTIKRMEYAPGRRPPVVVMLTSKAGAIDRIRGTLAGCDAYLTKPLAEDELVRVISSHDEVFQRGFESTYSVGALPPN